MDVTRIVDRRHLPQRRRAVPPRVVPGADTYPSVQPQEDVMTVRDLTTRFAEHHRDHRQQRELQRALESAPTAASRQELLAALARR